LVSEIGRGLMVLVGISRDDEEKDLVYMARKIVNLRIFDDPVKQKRWDKSVQDVGGEILCVSQFTLYSKLKGNTLDFHHAMAPTSSRSVYESFLTKVRAELKDPARVKDGAFGKMMDVSLVNDGPVTITLDSHTKGNPSSSGPSTSKSSDDNQKTTEENET
uniref:D-aminoacyl-tRNA deacylase n=2 Tax=Hymenolepis diminuta TaxID=6216 RepID=A0A0R3SAV6_HYMDI